MADRFKPCAVDGCKRNAHRNANGKRGWCSAHYQRWRNYGDPSGGGEYRTLRWSSCSVAGCDAPHEALGFCAPHYNRWRAHGDPQGGRPLKGVVEAFFLNHVLPYEGNDCLVWPFSRKGVGYASMGDGDYVSRRVCEEEHGPPPTPDHDAAHSCGKGHLGCVAKRHLRWATRSENHMDKVAHGTHNRGERHPMSRITENDVLEIRALRGVLSQREAARMKGISQQTVSDIQSRRSWSWLV